MYLIISFLISSLLFAGDRKSSAPYQTFTQNDFVQALANLRPGKVQEPLASPLPACHPDDITEIEEPHGLQLAELNEDVIEDDDDIILKIKSKSGTQFSGPVTLSEYLHNHPKKIDPSIPPLEKLKVVREELKEDLEDFISLNDILVFVKTPKGELLPMTLADARRLGSIFTPDQIKNPSKIVDQKLGQIFDLRRIFVNVKNPEGEEVSISLSEVVRKNVRPMKDVANMLLNKMKPGNAEIYQFTRTPNGKYAFDPMANVMDLADLPNARKIDGLTIVMKGGSHGGAISVDSATYDNISHSKINLSVAGRANKYYEDENISTGAFFYANPRSAGLGADIRGDFGQVRPWYGFTKGWQGFGISGKTNITSSEVLEAVSGGAYVAWGSNYAGIGGNVSLVTDSGTVAVSLWGARSKDREVSVIDKKHMIPANRKDNFLRIRVVDKTGVSGRIGLSAADPLSGAGVGARLDVNKNKTVTREVNLPEKDAAIYLEDAEKPLYMRLIEKGFFSRGLPLMSEPFNLAVGDKIVEKRSQGYSAALVVGIAGVPTIPVQMTGGLSKNQTDDFEISLERPEQDLFVVKLNPSQFREKGGFLRFGDFFGVSGSKGVALAFKQNFEFRFPQGENHNTTYTALMNALLNSELPNGLSSDFNALAEGHLHGGDIVEHIKKANARLKREGINAERTLLEIVHLESTRMAAIIASANLFGIEGFSFEKILANGERFIGDKEAGVVSSTTMNKKQRKTPWSGLETSNAYATTNVLWENDSPGNHRSSVQGITLTGEFNDSKAIHGDLNRIRRTLINDYGMVFGEFELEGEGQDVKVLTERKLNIDDLERLKDSKNLDLAVTKSGLPHKILATFHGNLQTKSVGDIARDIERKIYKHGPKFMSAVHVLLDRDPTLVKLKATSSFYTKPVSQAEAFIQEWSRVEGDEKKYVKIDGNSSSREIRNFFENGNKILRKIDRGLRHLQDNKFFLDDNDPRTWPEGNREAKTTTRESLITARQMMKDIMNFSSQGMQPSEEIKIYKSVPKSKRSLTQRLVLLKGKYPNPIIDTTGRPELRKRFSRVERFLEDLSAKREHRRVDETLLDEERDIIEQRHGQMEVDAKKIIDLSKASGVKLLGTLERTIPTLFLKKVAQEATIKGTIQAELDNKFLEPSKALPALDDIVQEEEEGDSVRRP